ncbi:MAG: NADH-quinone oxidoreductase subunit J [Bacteroidetes bacterium]|nr:NADH-quinone oxidoreductase subunit J [Bacteroidota bacterium]
MTQYLFYFLTFVAIFCALLVVFSKNPIYSALFLIVTFFATAGHYFLLNAQFLAAVHVIVYAGAIMVLFIYVIMMLNLNREVEPHKSTAIKIAATVCGCILGLVLVAALRETEMSAISEYSNPGIGLIERLGNVLFGAYMVPFEISTVLFLSAMVGAVFLSKKSIH